MPLSPNDMKNLDNWTKAQGLGGMWYTFAPTPDEPGHYRMLVGDDGGARVSWLPNNFDDEPRPRGKQEVIYKGASKRKAIYAAVRHAMSLPKGTFSNKRQVKYRRAGDIPLPGMGEDVSRREQILERIEALQDLIVETRGGALTPKQAAAMILKLSKSHLSANLGRPKLDSYQKGSTVVGLVKFPKGLTVRVGLMKDGKNLNLSVIPLSGDFFDADKALEFADIMREEYGYQTTIVGSRVVTIRKTLQPTTAAVHDEAIKIVNALHEYFIF